MRSYRLDAGAGLGGLRLEVSDLPVPGPGEVLVEVRAASLSYREAMILEGRYVLPVRAGGIPLAEGVGVVSATGPDVAGPPVGTRVVVAVFPRWQDGPFSRDVVDQIGGSLDGMLAEHVVLPATALVAIPDDLADLSDAEAATLPVAGLTAWNALTGGRGIRRGDTVLTLGTVGVSLFAVQLATATGARVIATTGNDARAGLLRELGADVVLNYRDRPDWPAAVRAATGGRGADLVVEVAGTLESSLAAVALGGEIAVVGFVGGRPGPTLDPVTIFTTGATLRPVAVGSRAQLVALLHAVGTHRIRPVLDRVFPFDDAPEAFRHYLGGTALGKVVITFAPNHERTAAMAARTGSAIWTGDLQEGSGRLVVGPQRWEAGYSFRSRFTDDAAGSTNPEELLAAAHAGCFSMSLTHVLTQAGSVPRSVATQARVRLRPVDGVPTIDLVELDTTVDVDGVDAGALQRHAETAEAGCAVSRALTGVAEIRVTARRHP